MEFTLPEQQKVQLYLLLADPFRIKILENSDIQPLRFGKAKDWLTLVRLGAFYLALVPIRYPSAKTPLPIRNL